MPVEAQNLIVKSKGHVIRSNFSCNLQRNVCCVASCKKKFTCNTPFCDCNCCIASCNKGRTTLYFSQRCETSCLRVTAPLQLATQFCQNGPIIAHLSLASVRYLVCYCTRCKLRKKLQTCDTPLQLERFLFVIVASQVSRKIASCNIKSFFEEIFFFLSAFSSNFFLSFRKKCFHSS